MLTLAQLILILIVAVPISAAVMGRLRVDIAALVIAVGLGIAQLIGVEVLGDDPDALADVISGFGRPVVMTLISLFIISKALDRIGVTRWLARRILALSGKSEARIMTLFTISAALLALFMNNVAVGALLLPSAMVAAKRAEVRPSKLLIPIAFGTLLGGISTYFTAANIIVDSLLRTASPPQAPLDVLAFTPTGGLIAVVGITFIALFGGRLLPDRLPMAEQMLSLPTDSELEDVYLLGERLWEARVLPESPYINKTLASTHIGQQFGLSVIAIWHGRQAIFYPAATQVLRVGDILVIVGREDRVSQLTEYGLAIGRENGNRHISERGVSFVEAILSPHSRAEGQTLKQLNFRKRFGYTAVALLRDGRSYRTDVADFPLKRGDAFLLVGNPAMLSKLHHNEMFIVLEPDSIDQPLQVRPALVAIAITALAIITSVMMSIPVYFTMLVAALLMVLLNFISMEDAYRAVEWQVIFLVAAMYSVSVAMLHTGLTDVIAQGLVATVAPIGTVGLAMGCFMLSALLTHIIGGQVSALVSGPIAITAAIALNTNPQAIAVATAIGCSAAYLSALGHPVNMLMVGPGNYKSTDFLRLGIPLMLITFFGVWLGMELFWGL